MPKVPVAWGEWRPDMATRDTQFAQDVENVFPYTSSYLPVPSLQPFSDNPIPPAPPPGQVVGLFSARTKDGAWKTYGGTRTKLYRWTGAAWVDVSRTTGGAYNCPVGEMWSFCQFGSWLIACQIGDVPQYLDVDAGSNFAALPGSPPIAHNCRTIGGFVILGGLASGGTIPGTTVATNRRQIIWSGLEDPTQWTSGLGLSDYQEMPDGGPVMGVSGDKIGYIVQDRAIRVLQYLPGDTTFVFSISKVVYDRGCVSEFGYCSIGDVLYFVSHDGFYALSGASLVPIGHERVNEYFLANSDGGRRNLVQAIVAVKPFIGWAYHSSTGTPDYYDRVIIYNWFNQRWAKWAINAQVWSSAALATDATDLDTDFAPEMPADADLDSTARSLDSFAYMGGQPRVSAVDPNGILCDLTGPNLQATLESGEAHLIPGNRAMVGDVYPLADGAAADVNSQAPGLIYDGTRERLQDEVTWSQAFPIEITGSAAVYNSARLHRFRHIIPAGTKWTHAQGVVADAQQDGTVA